MECSHGREPWNSIEEVCRPLARRGESHRPLRSDGVPRYVDGTSELRASLDVSPAKVPARRGRARRGVAASKADVDDAVHTLGGKKCDDGGDEVEVEDEDERPAKVGVMRTFRGIVSGRSLPICRGREKGSLSGYSPERCAKMDTVKLADASTYVSTTESWVRCEWNYSCVRWETV